MDDHDPSFPTSGEFEGVADFGPLGSLNVNGYWYIDNLDNVRIESVDIMVGRDSKGEELWRPLGYFFEGVRGELNDHLTRTALLDSQLIELAEICAERDANQWRAEYERPRVV